MIPNEKDHGIKVVVKSGDPVKDAALVAAAKRVGAPVPKPSVKGVK